MTDDRLNEFDDLGRDWDNEDDESIFDQDEVDPDEYDEED